MGPVRSCAARGTYRCGKGPVSLPAAGAAGGGGHRAGGEHPGLPAGTGGSGGAAGHPAGLYGFRADDRGHYAAGGLSAGAGVYGEVQMIYRQMVTITFGKILYFYQISFLLLNSIC